MVTRRTKTVVQGIAERNMAAPTGVKLPAAVNSGYGDHGASYTRPALENFKSTSQSPELDIYGYLHTLRSRSRVLAISAPLATSAIRCMRTAVVGRGLHLHCMPDFEPLGLTREAAKEWAQDVERKFELWAADRMSADLLGLNDFYELQQLAYKSWKESGDVFALFRYGKRTLLHPYSLRIQLIEADRVCTPYTQAGNQPVYPGITYITLSNGNKCMQGVEVDKDTGAIVAYYIASDYPSNTPQIEYKRVEKCGQSTGMPNILHLMDAERPGQLRGVPMIAPVIEPLLQLARYLNAEALAALLETYHSGYIETPDADKSIIGTPQAMKSDEEEEERDLSQLSPEPGGIFQLYPGETIKFNDVKRPGTQFAPFTEACARYIGAALEIPGDVLLKAYNASYSASRAALQDHWRKVMMERDWFASDFCAPIFEAWLAEAIALGDVRAPGYFSDAVTRQAWTRHQWNGAAMPHLDPEKEANAMAVMVEHGWITNEQATTQLNGGDWDANVADLAHEMDKLQAVQGLLQTAANLKQRQTDTSENDAE